MYNAFGKRIFDLIVTVPALLLLAPVIIVVAVLVRLRLGTPVLFRQKRPGFRGRPFVMFKFRTMTNARDANGKLLPDSERLTRFGLFLRASSLDELPELFNILRGDMSLVGPRPLLVEYLERYTPEQMRRHNVRPGLTGLAQVNGRNAICWEERFEMDCRYVDNVSFRLDASILLRTIGKVLRREAISHEGHATMAEFLGTGEK